ncbi:hypothetical protein [Absidia glauca]|uniref:KxDL domain-containing protein n=1 Tax=Absidia glauca TaxID=4829 RepID=A0A168LQZ6_ABSGL|nr:hypothetical protein [Absidia glauca]
MNLPQTIGHHLTELDQQEKDAATMIKTQDQCLDLYQTSQKNLIAFNNFSKARYDQVHGHFESHTKLLRQVKVNLDNVFIKLRKTKALLERKYPDEMKKALEKHPPIVVEDD